MEDTRTTVIHFHRPDLQKVALDGRSYEKPVVDRITSKGPRDDFIYLGDLPVPRIVAITLVFPLAVDILPIFDIMLATAQ